MDLTVALCTWNRGDRLKKALGSLAQVEVPSGLAWEIVVVDNGSTDHTPQVLDAVAADLPIVVVHETTLGLSHARNRAVAAARGAWILWLDDDVLVHPGWLAAYQAAIRSHPRASFMGGPVHPRFEAPMPPWLRDNWSELSDLYAVREVPGDGPVEEGYLPFGANFALRREALGEAPFDPSLGRVGAGLRGGEELAVLQGLMAAGGVGRWVVAAVVHHTVPPTRLTVSYVAKRLRALGEEDAERAWSDPQALRHPVWYLMKVVSAEVRYRYHRLASPPDVWLGRLRVSSALRGQLRWALRR